MLAPLEQMGPGARGPEVIGLVSHLAQYGYLSDLPNRPRPMLWRGDADWIRSFMPATVIPKDVVVGPEALPEAWTTHEDDLITRAVRRFQDNWGLRPSGRVDGPTLAKMQQPRCSIPDLEGVTMFDRTHAIMRLDIVHLGFRALANPVCAWQRSRLRFYVAEAPPAINKAQFTRRFEEMLTQWTDAAGMEKPEQSDRQGAEIQAFTYNGDGAGGTYAYTYFPCSGRSSGDGYYDANDAWSIDDQVAGDEVDLVSVILHELGHAMGLGHTRDPDAVMYPYIRFGAKKRQIQADDQAGIEELYRAAERFLYLGRVRD
jgi:hypothetical protein